MVDPEKALLKADLLLVLHDVSNKWTRESLSPLVLRLLHLHPNKESFLVLNKIDSIKEKRMLLKLTRQLTEGIIDGQAIITTPAPSKIRRDKKTIITETANPTTESNFPENPSETQVAKAIEGKIGWPRFKKVFMVSALEGDGVSDIMVILL